MRTIIFLTAVITYAFCTPIDSVVWSTEPIESDDVEHIISSATTGTPVLIFALKDFVLATFSSHANVYSSKPSDSILIQRIHALGHFSSSGIDKPIFLPLNTAVSIYSTERKPVTFTPLSTWTDLEETAVEQMNKLQKFTAVLSSDDAFIIEQIEKRQKRVSSDLIFPDVTETEEEAQRPKTDTRRKQGVLSRENMALLNMPVVLPPFGVADSKLLTTLPNTSCMLYLEAVNVVLMKSGTFSHAVVNSADGANKFRWSPSYVQCTNQTAEFEIDIAINGTVESIKADKALMFQVVDIISFKLTFATNIEGYWNLSEVALMKDLTLKPFGTVNPLSKVVVVKPKKTRVTQYMNVESVLGYAYACSLTQAAFLPAEDPSYQVGIGLSNIEVDLNAFKQVTSKKTLFKFNRDVSDCIGTFSPGSWMGIISSIVMVSILMFGYLMLQSVQTSDRFDDPKQKQIVINFKE